MKRTARWWIVLTSAAIAVFAPLPYLTASLQTLTRNESQLAANYADRPAWFQAVFYLHIIGGGLALLLSPVQFSARLRARIPRVHRAVGRVAFTAIGLGGLAGLVIAPVNLAGPIGVAGFGLLALLWISFAWTAFRAVRRRDFAEHRRWAIRTFALTYAAVTLRLWLGVLIAAQSGLAGIDSDLAFTRAYYVVPFLAWVPNLIVAERYLRRPALREPAVR
jgi:uncharacterized membrane protein